MEKSGGEMNHIVDQNTNKVSGDLNYEENEEEINNNNNELDCFITSLYLNENGDVMTTKTTTTTTTSASTNDESNDNNNKREEKEEKVHLFPKCEKFYSIVTQDDVSVSIKKALHAMKKKNTEDDEHNGDDEEENKEKKNAQKEGDPNIKLENKKQSKKGKNNKKTKNKKDPSSQDDKNSESTSTTNTTDDVTSTPVDSRFLEKPHLQYLTYKPALRDILERALYEIERMDTKRVMKRIEENNKDNKKGSKSDESEEKEGGEEAIHDDADDDEVDGEGDDEDDEQQEPDDDESTTSSSHSVLDGDNKKDNSVVEGVDNGDISEGDNEMNEAGSNDSNGGDKAPTAATSEAIPNHRDRVPPNKRMQITLNSFNKIYQHAYHMIYHPEKRICHTTDDRVLKKKQKQIQVFLYTHDNYFDVSSSAMFKRLDFLFSGIAGDLSHLDHTLSTSTSPSSSDEPKKASFSLDMRCLLDHPPLNSNEFLLHCTLGIFLDPKTQPDTLMIEDHISGTFSKAKDSNKPKVLFIKRGERPFKSWVENFETLEDHFSAHKNKNKNKQAINDIVKRPIILNESVLDKIQNAHFSHAMNTHRKNNNVMKKTHQKNNKDGNMNSSMMTNSHESMTNQFFQKMKSMLGVSSSQHHQQQRLYNGYEHHSNSRKKDNFTSADISIYGSCSTNLYLNDNDNSDVDISLSLPPLDSLQQELHSAILQSRKQQQQQQGGNLNKKNKKSRDELIQKEQITEIHEQYQRLLKRYMFSLKHKLERNICFNIQQCLHWARVPVMKGTYSTGKYVRDGVIKEEEVIK